MRVSFNLTLRKRIGLLVLVGLAIGLSLFSWLGVQSLNESTERTLEERLTIARIVASHLDETLRYVLAQLQNVADFNDATPDEGRFAPAADSLRDVLANSGIMIQDIVLLDRDGKALQAKPADSRMIGANMSGFPEVSEALETGLPTVSGLVSTPLIEVPVVLVTVPILNAEGKPIGAVSSAIDINRSSIGAFSESIVLGATGYTEIVDGNGIVLARTEPGSPPQAFERSDHPGRFAELINEGKSTVRTCHRCHGPEDQPQRYKDVLAFAPLSTASWGVAIRQSEEEALAPTHELKRRLLIIGAIVLASASLLVWIAMQGVVKPIRMLTVASKKVAAGDFKAVIPIKSGDEIGQLSTAFSTMTQELARSRDELVSRTEELSTLNAIAAAVSQSLDLDQCLNVALARVLELMGVEAGWVNVFDETSGSALRVYQGLSQELAEKANELIGNGGLTQDKATLAESVTVRKIEKNLGPFDIETEPGEPLILTRVLLSSKGQVLGTLNLLSRGRRQFTPQDHDLLAAIGLQVGSAIENAKLYTQVQHVAILEERDRIGRETHDGLAQVLGYLNFQAGVLEKSLNAGDWTKVQEELREMRKVADEAYSDVREAILGLRTSLAPGRGLIRTVTEYVDKFSRQTNIKVQLSAPSEEHFQLSPAAEVQVIRIIQEALTNIRKHAHNSEAWVKFETNGLKATVTIEDNGSGFDPSIAAQKAGHHFGLQTMRERAQGIGGDFLLETRPGQGTKVTVRIPLEKEDNNVKNTHTLGR